MVYLSTGRAAAAATTFSASWLQDHKVKKEMEKEKKSFCMSFIAVFFFLLQNKERFTAGENNLSTQDTLIVFDLHFCLLC